MTSIKLLVSYAQTFGTQIHPNYNRTFVLSRCLHLESYYKTSDSELVYSYNRAIDHHIKCGSLTCAHQVFDEMPQRDAVSWNLFISGYKRNGMIREALEFYAQMISQGVRENPSTFSTVLSICSSNNNFQSVSNGRGVWGEPGVTTLPLQLLVLRDKFGFHFEGRQVHCRVVLFGLSGNLYIGSAIVGLYMNMGLVDVGLRVLDQMPERNFAVWNVVLRGFCELGLWERILGLYSRIKSDGVELNELMVCYLLQGCANGRFVSQGEQLHCHALKSGMVESNLFVANAMVDFYSANGSLIDTEKSFESIPYEDVISWSSIVFAYAANGLLFDAVEQFKKMQFWSKPSVRSLVALLNLCSETKNIIFGRQMHSVALKLGFDCGSIHVQSGLTDMYGKCYDIDSSFCVFDGCPELTMECCNPLLTSMLYCGFIEEVIELFKFMVDRGIKFDEVSLSTTLKAMSGSYFASLSSCRLLHSCAIKSGLDSRTVVSNSLIDLYAKLGQVGNSLQIFESLSSPNVVCYTSIISGYARNGLGIKCLKFLELMIQKGLKPDGVTLLCVLMGCNHSGLVKEGRRVFDSMKTLHGIDPEQRHYSCMVDLFGRAGFVNEAEDLLKHSPVKNDSIMWTSLLRSCRMHKNEVVGQRVVRWLVELEPGDPSASLQASRYYSEMGDSELSTDYKNNAMARKVIRKLGHSFVDMSYHCPTG